MPLSTAYMFKGTSLIFVLLISALLFGEAISLNNVIGAVIIIGGIVLFANS
jgi:multidrug transporter EmrE-like cation transporter